MVSNVNFRKCFSSLNWNKEHFKIGLQTGLIITMVIVLTQVSPEIAGGLAAFLFALCMVIGEEESKNKSRGAESISIGILIPVIIIIFPISALTGKYTLLAYMIGGSLIAFAAVKVFCKLPDKSIG